MAVVASAPGKVLMTGGYLVLERPNAGIVLSTNARFYAIVKPLHEEIIPECWAWGWADVKLTSPQMDRETMYKLSLKNLKLQSISSSESRNPFVEYAVEYAIAAAHATFDKDKKDMLQKLLLKGLDITILGCNEFYSYRNQIEACGLPLTPESLASLPPFTSITFNAEDSIGENQKPEVAKTGLGSSAAMTTAVVAALLHYLGVVSLSSFSEDQSHGRKDDSDLDIVHVIAQTAHCIAQGKVGSGFDVSSAVFGSQRYVRFSPEVLSSAQNAGMATPLTEVIYDVLKAKWDHERTKFSLPPLMTLLLGEPGSGGSSTPSMVGAVKKWQKSDPQNSLETWRKLSEGNSALEMHLNTLCKLAERNYNVYECLINACSLLPAEKWLERANEPSQADIVKELLGARDAMLGIRYYMRKMGEAAGIPIEPESQTHLLDTTMSMEGVLLAGVPGAGGFDAVFAVTLGPSSKNVTKTWNSLNVLAMLVTEDPRGVSLEDHDPRAKMETYGSSFSNVKSYLRALSDTPHRLARRACSVSTSFEETSRVRARSGGDMKRSLRWYDLVGFGVGGMVGAGVFVTSGRASRMCAGPAVVLSYAIAGFCALLSAFCYTEFAVDMPVAGGAFSYIRITFGEFLAFLTGANLIIDYVLSNAAVARSFTGYLCTALGISTESRLRITVNGLPKGFNEIDIVAVLVVLALTVIICYSTRESSMLNMVLTVLHLVFIVFVIVIGFTRGDTKNFREAGDENHASGFFPFGASGVFNGAAMVYLSYIGYDAVSTMAEEVRNPVKDIPAGVSGSVILVTVLYCLMAASMSMLLPYDMIDTDAPFSGAFMGSDGWRWVSNVIGVGASFGILTSLLVAMLGQARYMCVIGRSSVVPAWFARVHPKTSTPVNASVFLGICTAAIALFTDLQILLNLVSIGTLFVFYMVANAVIYKRYVSIGVTNPWPTLSFLFCFSLTSILFTLLWQFAPPGMPKAFMLGACTAIAIAVLQLFHYMVPQVQKPEFWGVPLMPWIPSMSIFLNIFLLGSLDRPSYIRFGFFSALAVLVYVLYSVHASFDAEEDGTLGQKRIELVKESIEVQDHTLKV